MLLRRTTWLLRVTAAVLAIASASFIAHLGVHGHSDECHACDIAAHALAISSPLTEVTAPQRVAGTVFAVDTATVLPKTRSACAPRAPPAS